MSNNQPYEVVAQPFSLYLAPVGTAFPAVTEDPGAPWVLVGTSGPLNYQEDGVKVKHGEKIDIWKALGSTGARKAFRTEESMEISLKLADMTLEQYQLALNGNDVTTTAAAGPVAGTKKLGLSRGRLVTQYALLARGEFSSPYGESWNTQYECPVVVQTGSSEIAYTKGKPADLDLTFTVLEDPNADSDDERFGRLISQHEDPVS